MREERQRSHQCERPVETATPLGDPREQTQSSASRRQRSNGSSEFAELCYTVGHDLQEPLRALAHDLKIAADTVDEGDGADAGVVLERAQETLERMQGMLSSLLDYSRTGVCRLERFPTDCGEVVSRALSNLQPRLRDAKARVTHDALPLVYADGMQLVRVFQNLISNALKFRTERRPEIHVHAEHRAGEWLFSVRDNGVGMESAQAWKAFGIFQRLHPDAQVPGTGMGLAICQKLVERHGGRIWIESKPAIGTTVWFTLPEPSESAEIPHCPCGCGDAGHLGGAEPGQA